MLLGTDNMNGEMREVAAKASQVWNLLSGKFISYFNDDCVQMQKDPAIVVAHKQWGF